MKISSTSTGTIKTISIRIPVYLLITILTVLPVSSAPTNQNNLAVIPFGSRPKDAPPWLMGLVRVERLPKRHWWQRSRKLWIYDLRNDPDTEFVSRRRLKQFPDLRTYQVRHPLADKVSQGGDRWAGVSTLVQNLVVGAGVPIGLALINRPQGGYKGGCIIRRPQGQ